MLFFILGEYYLVIKLRDLQDTGTHPLLSSMFLAIVLILSIMWLFSDPERHTLNLVYYSGCSICQLFTFVLALTLRSNGLDNYKILPQWIVMIGSFFYLVFYVGLLWHESYLIKHGQVTHSSLDHFALLEWAGSVGLFFNWCFIFFLITRTNEHVRH